MQTKLLIRIIFISIILAGIVWTGIYTFIRLRSNEVVYRMDLFSAIPENSELFFYFPDPQQLKEGFPIKLLPDSTNINMAATLFRTLQATDIQGGNELLLSYAGNDGLIIYRTTPEIVKKWEKEQIASGFFPFLPQKETYKDIEIQTFLTPEDRFFCYAYHQGAFLGSFSRSLLIRSIDELSAPVHIENDPSFKQVKSTSGKTALATCFFRNGNWFAADITKSGENYWISGCLSPEFCTPAFYQTMNIQVGKLDFQAELIPAQTAAIVYFNTDSTFFRGTHTEDILMGKYGTGNITCCYHFSNDSVTSFYKTTCIQLKDKNAFLKELNDSLPADRLSVEKYIAEPNSDYVLYRIYRLTSFNMTHSTGIFQEKRDSSFFTFYENNLLVSASTEALQAYWEAIHEKRTFTGHPLSKAYQESINEDTGVLILTDNKDASVHPLVRNDFIAPYSWWIKNTNGLFLQFIPENGSLFFNGLIIE